MRYRKAIHTSTSAVLADTRLTVYRTATCNDGTIWAYNRDKDNWVKLAPIPGTEEHANRGFAHE